MSILVSILDKVDPSYTVIIRRLHSFFRGLDPVNGDGFFLVLPRCNTVCMNVFLEQLSKAYPDDYIVLVCDGAAWHKSGTLKSFPNIELMFIPPYTPEMNPIEQIWKELRAFASVTVALKLRDGGPKTPCRWP